MPGSHEQLALKCSQFCTKYLTILTLLSGVIQHKKTKTNKQKKILVLLQAAAEHKGDPGSFNRSLGAD